MNYDIIDIEGRLLEGHGEEISYWASELAIDKDNNYDEKKQMLMNAMDNAQTIIGELRDLMGL